MRPVFAAALCAAAAAMMLLAEGCGSSGSPQAPATSATSGTASSGGGTPASGSGSGASTGSGSSSGAGAGASGAGSGSPTGSGASASGDSGATGEGGSPSTGADGGSSSASSGGPSAGSGDSGTATSGGTTGDGGASCVSPVGAATRDWGKLFADTVIQQGFGTFGATSYPVGLVMHGIYKVYNRTKDPRYLSFLTSWASANSSTPPSTSVDGIMHMTAVADAYQLSMNPALKGPLDATRRIFDTYPRTTDGAFWHNTGARGQNWGDTSFMALSFLTRYGAVMNDTTTYAEGVKQITLFASHLKNPATGLTFHAYDETGTAPWVVAGTHHSPESWGRAMGWYLMATVMVLEELPANDPGRPQLEAILKDSVVALKNYQDPASGRWFQVIDKGSMAGNWLETSASAMFSYVTWWAATHGLVDSTYCSVATKGFNGVLQEASADPTKLLTGVCVGTGVGDYAYYIGRAHTQYNDFHGLGSFLLMWEGMQ
ncbi:MAG: glycoside hydrolase family 88 protein [Myxococcota bacterium]|nr:glycoside hydrolase family 88 protein [Myxococcota bacterium]